MDSMGPCPLAPWSRHDPMEFATSDTANSLAAPRAAVGLKSLLRYRWPFARVFPRQTVRDAACHATDCAVLSQTLRFTGRLLAGMMLRLQAAAEVEE